MGLISFVKNAGAKLFGKKEEEAPKEEQATLKASALLAHVKGLELPYKSIKISLREDDVTLEGDVENQMDAEKIALTLGNVSGVDKVENLMKVEIPTPEAKYHTVVSGDNLSKIAKEFYGESNKYHAIFEANKPMLSHPDKIYPGQVLRIPEL